MVKSGTWKLNEIGDGYMPCCYSCGKPYADGDIGDVKNYPDDGAIAVFFICGDCDEESMFVYKPLRD